jgi:hypothetical protein
VVALIQITPNTSVPRFSYDNEFDILYVGFRKTTVAGHDIDPYCVIFRDGDEIQGAYIYDFKRFLRETPERVAGYAQLLGVPLTESLLQPQGDSMS